MKPRDRVALLVAVSFAGAGALWFVAWDHVLPRLVVNPSHLAMLQRIEAWIFVVLASTFLYILTRWASGRSAAGPDRRSQLIEQLEGLAVIELDGGGRVRTWGGGAASLVGRAAAEMIGRPVSAVFGRDVEAGWPDLAGLGSDGRTERDGWIERPDGSRLWVRLTVAALPDPGDGDVRYSCVVRDLSERKQQERAQAELLVREHGERIQAENAAEWAQYLAESADVLAGTLDHRLAAKRVVEMACARIADWSGIWLLRPDGAVELTEVFHRDRPRQPVVDGLRGTTIGASSRHPVQEAVRTSQPLLVEVLTPSRLRDAIPADTERELVERLGMRSAIVVPLNARGRTLGALVFATGDSGRIYTDAQVTRVRDLGHRAALALDNARLFEEAEAARAAAEAAGERVRQQLERLAALRSIDLAITGSVDLRVTLSVVLDQVMAQLEVDAVNVLLLDTATRSLRSAGYRGFRSDAPVRARPLLGEGASGRAAVERRVIRVSQAPPSREVAVTDLMALESFVEHAAVPLIAKGEVKGVLEVFHRSPLRGDDEWLPFLEALAGQAAIALDNAALFEDLQRSSTELTLAYDRTLEGWSRALEFRDRETQGHAERVADLTLRLAGQVGVREADFVHLRRGALLHDIGKMAIPDSILLKPGPLTADEWEIMKQHPVYAYRLLSPIPFLRQALDIPLFHHERWAGGGYPYGLEGEAIPLAARIFAVADVWDALLSPRPYRAQWTESQVRTYLEERSGIDLDPRVVGAFFALHGDLPRV